MEKHGVALTVTNAPLVLIPRMHHVILTANPVVSVISARSAEKSPKTLAAIVTRASHVVTARFVNPATVGIATVTARFARTAVAASDAVTASIAIRAMITVTVRIITNPKMRIRFMSMMRLAVSENS
jgi:hypothetical protein